MKVIFLDFDGVIVVYPNCASANSDCVKRLNYITGVTGAAIVVSSSWRSREDYKEVLRSWGVTGAIVGHTRLLGESVNNIDPSCGRTRADEIREWLNSTPVENFVILDDIENGIKQQQDIYAHLIKTEFLEGLTRDHVRRAILFLNGDILKDSIRREYRTLLHQN